MTTTMAEESEELTSSEQTNLKVDNTQRRDSGSSNSEERTDGKFSTLTNDNDQMTSNAAANVSTTSCRHHVRENSLGVLAATAASMTNDREQTPPSPSRRSSVNTSTTPAEPTQKSSQSQKHKKRRSKATSMAISDSNALFDSYNSMIGEAEAATTNDAEPSSSCSNRSESKGDDNNKKESDRIHAGNDVRESNGNDDHQNENLRIVPRILIDKGASASTALVLQPPQDEQRVDADFDPPNPLRPSRRRYTMSTTPTTTALQQQSHNHYPITTHQNAHRWDGFVRRGTRLKTFLDDAMQQVKCRFAADPDDWMYYEGWVEQQQTEQQGQNKKRSRGEGRGNSNREDTGGSANTVGDCATRTPPNHNKKAPKQPALTGDHRHMADIAREKTSQILQLQRKLEQAQSRVSSLEATNESLREEVASGQQRLERTAQALRIAGQNAAKARDDADAAEATAATLAQSLQAMQTVVTETKRASQLLHKEHQELHMTVATVEGQVLQKEADLARALKQVQTLQQEHDELTKSKHQFKQEQTALQETVETQKQQLEDLQHTLQERETVEEARKKRAAKIEQEWRQAQDMLVQATAAQDQAESSQVTLKETIQQLQQANERLHQQLKLQQENSTCQVERLQQALTKAETASQQLQIRAESAEELTARLEQDKETTVKQLEQMKRRTSVGSVAEPPTRPRIRDHRMGSSASLPLGKENDNSTSPAPASDVVGVARTNNRNICCICFKASFGLMKACQCGKKTCDKRAHWTCAQRSHPGPSVSHPGTPAPPLPLVFCHNVLAATAAAAGAAGSNGNEADSALENQHL